MNVQSVAFNFLLFQQIATDIRMTRLMETHIPMMAQEVQTCKFIFLLLFLKINITLILFYREQLPQSERLNAPIQIGSPNCDVSQWGEWSECSSKCDSGSKTRNRHYLLPSKSSDCAENLFEVQPCRGNQADCPPTMNNYESSGNDYKSTLSTVYQGNHFKISFSKCIVSKFIYLSPITFF